MRKICVLTGTRAEYGLLRWLMQEIDDDEALQLQVVATGMHLSPEFGLTYRAIEADGFTIDEKVEMLLSSDTPVGTAKSMGVGTMGLADAFARLDPDLLVVLGDRFEVLAAAQAALVRRLPVAHLHGGETTEGAVDESIRHAVTKMAHFHFVGAEPYRRRVIQLGEHPTRVKNYGAPGLDNLNRLHLLDREALEAALDFELGEPTFLVTYHPATLSKESNVKSLQALLDALDRFPEATVVFTKANADAEGRRINERVAEYAAERPERVRLYDSLGQQRYLSALKAADVVVGNSSSGLAEAPAADTPTVNIGGRQRGRLRADSVIDCPAKADAIAEAVEQALSPSFQDRAREANSPYGSGDASRRVKDEIKKVPLDEDVLTKRFYDVDFSEKSNAAS